VLRCSRQAYRTALLVATQRFPVPLSVSLRSVECLASNNQRLHTHYLGVILSGVF